MWPDDDLINSTRIIKGASVRGGSTYGTGKNAADYASENDDNHNNNNHDLHLFAPVF